jgi:hypothetical protein
VYPRALAVGTDLSIPVAHIVGDSATSHPFNGVIIPYFKGLKIIFENGAGPVDCSTKAS